MNLPIVIISVVACIVVLYIDTKICASSGSYRCTICKIFKMRREKEKSK